MYVFGRTSFIISLSHNISFNCITNIISMTTTF